MRIYREIRRNPAVRGARQNAVDVRRDGTPRSLIRQYDLSLPLSIASLSRDGCSELCLRLGSGLS